MRKLPDDWGGLVKGEGPDTSNKDRVEPPQTPWPQITPVVPSLASVHEMDRNVVRLLSMLAIDTEMELIEFGVLKHRLDEIINFNLRAWHLAYLDDLIERLAHQGRQDLADYVREKMRT